MSRRYTEEELIQLEREDRLATPGEAIAEYAWNAGAEEPERAWILTPWDVWKPNPHYVGPIVPHPESGEYEEEDPSPWCSGCGAMERSQCHCPPIADNE